MNTPSCLKSHIVHPSGRAKTVCTSAVLAHFGISPSSYHYSGKPGDVERILRRHGYAVRSRRSRLPKRCSVGQARTKIRTWGETAHYFVHVHGHGMLLDAEGRTVVDTDPRTRDRRGVLRIFAVYRAD